MGHAALSIAIENKFKVAWGATTSVRYDNVPFTVPTTSWVSIETMEGDSITGSLGGTIKLRRTLGSVVIRIYTPIGDGSKPARTYADSVKLIFRDLQISGITFKEGSSKRVGEVYYSATGAASETAQWYQMLVVIPFHYDEFV